MVANVSGNLFMYARTPAGLSMRSQVTKDEIWSLDDPSILAVGVKPDPERRIAFFSVLVTEEMAARFLYLVEATLPTAFNFEESSLWQRKRELGAAKTLIPALAELNLETSWVALRLVGRARKRSRVRNRAGGS